MVVIIEKWLTCVAKNICKILIARNVLFCCKYIDMMEVIKVKKGLDINLLGKADEVFPLMPEPKFYAIKPIDFQELVPKMVVKENDSVKIGTPLFFDKNRPEITIVSPVSGVVKAITRGDRRLILEVIIESDGKFESEFFHPLEIKTASSDEIKDKLLTVGAWSFIKQRPYNIIANQSVTPRDIFISGYNSAPLAPNSDVVISGKAVYLQAAIDALSKLTPGKIYLGISDRTASKVLNSLKGVRIKHFSGPHPAGNVGTQINFIKPINKGEVVWTIQLQDLVSIGKSLLEGVFDSSRTIAITGSSYKKPCYIHTHIGACIHPYVENKVDVAHLRYISGNVLTGTQIEPGGYLGYSDNQITVIPEGDEATFLGWAKLNYKKFSISRTFFSWMMSKREYALSANLNGSKRAIVLSGEYDKVFPLNILPEQLIKAILAKDIDAMEQLGIYEVVEEDFALCEFIDVSKLELQKIVRSGLGLMMKELG